ncbi:hypothetical protein [Spirosoma rhododendri]|uniref:Curlin associated repeat-containing protein n=1 Tax=Spirosoma rhododendri TaxID=2728024 RepID=A0A7L5DJS1_9BACT|nr:hypothetical protein [Spirosoma rhododendri]QJD78699.1 hypothetical protein HH216_09860 [Spirosoma rhododendri]
MKRLFILLLGMICGTASAQVNSVPTNSLDAYWNLTSIPNQAQVSLQPGLTNLAGLSGSSNEVTARQDGLNNTAQLSVMAGSQNQLTLTQANNANYADATLSGVSNTIVINQTGGNNNLAFGLNGTNNRLALTQDGGDRLQMVGLQQNNTRLEVNQGAGNNSLTIDNTTLFKDVNGTGIPNLRIEQTGGATATIQNGRIFGN